MQNKVSLWVACAMGCLLMTAGIQAHGQDWGRKDKLFSGVINAYSPQTTSASGAVTGPYEVRGPWSLKLKRNGTRADFSAALNMEFSDGWVLSQPTRNFDPTLRNAHTHHITLTDSDVIAIANGFQISGIATFTLSGNPAPATVSPSALVIQITGGSDVEYSNITLTFQTPGSNHFGTAPLPGVVRSVQEER